MMTFLESATRSKRVSFAGYSLAFLMMTALASARHGVGTDWLTYLEFYENTEESTRIEAGYAFFNDLFSHLGVQYNVFLLAMNLACVAMMASFLRRVGALSVAAVVIFYSDLFLYYNLSGMRQAVATAITCFAFQYALSKRPLSFFSLVAIAATFHLSALIAILIYFVPRERISWRIYILVCAAGFVLYSYLEPIAAFITENSLKDATYYLFFIKKIDNIEVAYFLGLTKRLIILGIIVASRKRLREVPHFIYMANIYVLGLLIYMSLYLISADLGVRLSSYFIIFDMVIFSIAIWQQPNLSVRIGLTALVCFISTYKLIGYASDPYYRYAVFF